MCLTDVICMVAHGAVGLQMFLQVLLVEICHWWMGTGSHSLSHALLSNGVDLIRFVMLICRSEIGVSPGALNTYKVGKRSHCHQANLVGISTQVLETVTLKLQR